VQAGFLLSLVQLAGMCTGVAFGVLADGFGLRRSLLTGLGVLALASALGGLATGAPMLMLLRAPKASASCWWCCRHRAWCGSWCRRSGCRAPWACGAPTCRWPPAWRCCWGRW
jgi:MFS family permease